MTDDERATYALAQRENCRPMECSLDALCWVTVGGAATLEPATTRASRCLACGGKLLSEQWRTPEQFRLSPHGRLNPRAVESKRARPREPDQRGQAPRGREPGEQSKGAAAFTLANGAR